MSNAQANSTVNTTEAAKKIGVEPIALIEELETEGLISRTRNRHYKAEPFLVRANMATSGDLRWTNKGVKFLKSAYSFLKA